MNFFDSIILGIIEGITEFLPISSTAHLILTADLLGLSQSEFLKSFEIIIQFGAILAVVVLYWKLFLKWEVLKKLIVAFIPTGILGLIFYKIIKTYFLESTSLILWTLFLGGIFLIIFEKWHKEKENASEDIANISYKHCFYIGLFQSIAMIPGISRSATTILGGLLIGLRRKTIVEFSFLLAVPTMLVASGFDLLNNIEKFSLSESHLLAVGFITSFGMAILGIKFFLAYIQKRTFIAFGIYRIIIVILFLVK
ncbi:MAG: undecaprenyl-diphosphatase UppP [Candidatus Moranbacteria bacterium RIFOXYA12_FULL_35_19]|nr:MAG: Undecaprenyl-diphosphatase [Candidatus Moranbacteria bacterium GW2011_GWF2_35_39]OGI32442.1 MAG: undecaprenyl-diphosphatase UppP [Candidatus Moranbacteria bacterium RIFOXYC12_FULL_36_13]OGI35526.1 MAG: undecaprenyl-diphosphatase UppP [Candidatus Moranbacteria bacterium RIFOXYA12_FULL_35_19]